MDRRVNRRCIRLEARCGGACVRSFGRRRNPQDASSHYPQQRSRECRTQTRDCDSDNQSDSKVYPGEALVILNGEKRKAMADQIMAASKSRLKRKMGVLSRADLIAVEDAVLSQLGIRR